MKIRPIRTSEELDQVFEQAKADGHDLIAPSHAVMSDAGGLRGALSFPPTVLVWMNSKENTAVDSIKTLALFENHVAMNGAKVMCVPCTKDSPFFPVMEKLGFFSAGEVTLFVKGL